MPFSDKKFFVLWCTSYREMQFLSYCGAIFPGDQTHLTQRQLSPSAPAGRRTPWCLPSGGTLQVNRGYWVNPEKRHQSQSQKQNKSGSSIKLFFLPNSWTRWSILCIFLFTSFSWTTSHIMHVIIFKKAIKLAFTWSDLLMPQSSSSSSSSSPASPYNPETCGVATLAAATLSKQHLLMLVFFSCFLPPSA